jgi:hypothetical protein
MANRRGGKITNIYVVVALLCSVHTPIFKRRQQPTANRAAHQPAHHDATSSRCFFWINKPCSRAFQVCTAVPESRIVPRAMNLDCQHSHELFAGNRLHMTTSSLRIQSLAATAQLAVNGRTFTLQCVLAVPVGDFVCILISFALQYAVASYEFRTVQGMAVHWADYASRARKAHVHGFGGIAAFLHMHAACFFLPRKSSPKNMRCGL